MTNDTHRNWMIAIEQDRYNCNCWVTDPSGEEYPVYIPCGYDNTRALSVARAFINKMERCEAEVMG